MTGTLVRNKLIVSLAFVFLLIASTIFSLNLVTQKASAGAPVCTWTGGGANKLWSTALNWSCGSGTVPVDGTTIILSLTSANIVSAPSNNDLPATNTYSGIQINITPNADSQFLYMSGNTVKLSGNMILNNTTNFLAPNIQAQFAGFTLTGNSTISTIGATTTQINFSSGTFAMGANNLTFDSTGVSTVQTIPSKLGLGFMTVTGSGNFTFLANANQPAYFELSNATMTSYTGNIVATQTQLSANCASPTGFGTAAGSTTLNMGTIVFCQDSGTPGAVTIPENFVFSDSNNVQWSNSGIFVSEGTFTNTYAKTFYSNQTLNLSGNITLRGISQFATAVDMTFSGTITGAYPIQQYAFYDRGGRIIITSGSNGSTTTNGTYRLPLATLTTLSDSQPAATVFIGALNQVAINGTRNNVLVKYGGILNGSGTIGTLTSVGGKIATGNSPGIMNTGNVSYDSTTSMDVEIGGTTPGTGYDQLNVTGTVSLGSATLNVSHYAAYVPGLYNSFVIINNDSTDAVTGTFAGLAQGASTVIDGVTYVISYNSGTGNDVVLTATATPGSPGTAGALAKPVNIALAAGVILAGVGVLFLRKRTMMSRK